MELINKQSITLDFYKSHVIPTYTFYQHDNNQIEFVIKNNGDPADLSGISRILLNIKRPDGRVVSRELTNEGNVILYKIQHEEMKVSGPALLTLQFYNNEGERLSTAKIKIYFAATIEANVEFKDKEGTLYQQIIFEMEGLKDQLYTLNKLTEEKGETAESKGNFAEEKAQEAIDAAELAAEEAANLSQLKTDVTGATEAASAAAEAARTNADHAKTQGDYAKEQADVAAQRTEELNGLEVSQFYDRQEEFSRQLAETAKKSYVDQQISNIGSASPKGTYATVSDLRTSHPTGISGIYVVTEDGKWYYWNGEEWTAGGLYQSTGVGEGEIDYTKTNFVKRVSRNLFLKENATLNTAINSDSGLVFTYADQFTVKFEVMPETTYTRSKSGYVRSGVLFDSAMTYIKKVLPSELTFTTPSDAKYFIDNGYMQYIDGYQFEKGNIATPYDEGHLEISNIKIDYSSIKNLPDTVVKEDDTYVIDKRTLNLLDKTKVNSTGYYNDLGAFVTGTYLNDSGLIPVKKGKVYYINRLGGSQPIYTFWTKEGVFISGQKNVAYNVTVPDDDAVSYMRVAILATEIDSVMITEGIPTYGTYFPFNSPMKHLKTHWYGKKSATIGDSLTQAGYWQPMLSNVLGLNNIVIAQSGGNMTAIAGFVSQLPAGIDVLTVWAGTNDFFNGIALGTLLSTDKNTYYGALKHVSEYVSTNFPATKLIFITPLQRYSSDMSTWSENTKGYKINPTTNKTLEDYANAVIETADVYGIPVLDMYHDSGVNKFNIASYSDDKLHPTRAGFEKLGWKIVDKIKAI